MFGARNARRWRREDCDPDVAGLIWRAAEIPKLTLGADSALGGILWANHNKTPINTR